MSEKQQRTAESMRQKMLNRYGDEVQHKHNKNHNPYRQHYRTHPVERLRTYEDEVPIKEATGMLKAIKLRKIRKRLDKGRIH